MFCKAGAALTFFGHSAPAPEHGAVEEADQQRHEHARQVVGRAAPIRQPELAGKGDELGESGRRVGAGYLHLCVLFLALVYEMLYQFLIFQVQLAGLHVR